MTNNNIARTMVDLVTPRQLVAIRAIANSQKIDPEDFCMELMSCKPEELSRRSASCLIDCLKDEDLIAQFKAENSAFVVIKHTCFAVGCHVEIPRIHFFCGPHHRLIPIAIRAELSRRSKDALRDAIKAIATKERKTKLYNELEMAASR